MHDRSHESNDEATATRMGLTDQETYVRGLKTSL